MSPNTLANFTVLPCTVCRRGLGGPLVVCAACGATVHSHCSAALQLESCRETCIRNCEHAEQQRAQQQFLAGRLGFATARGSELIGTALGAASAAGVAAGRFLVAGAQAGARSALVGSGSLPQQPAVEITLPRPASLPPPLSGDDFPADSRAPIVLESAEAAQGREERRGERSQTTDAASWRRTSPSSRHLSRTSRNNAPSS